MWASRTKRRGRSKSPTPRGPEGHRGHPRGFLLIRKRSLCLALAGSVVETPLWSYIFTQLQNRLLMLRLLVHGNFGNTRT